MLLIGEGDGLDWAGEVAAGLADEGLGEVGGGRGLGRGGRSGGGLGEGVGGGGAGGGWGDAVGRVGW